MGMLSCDKRGGECRQGCEKYLPLINCERGKKKIQIKCVSSMSVQLEFADLCKEVLLSVGIYSQCPHTHTFLSSYIHQHADCSYLIYQPQMAAVNEEFPPQLNSYAMHGKRLACRKETET